MIANSEEKQYIERKEKELDYGYDEWRENMFTEKLVSMLEKTKESTLINMSNLVLRTEVEKCKESLCEYKGAYIFLEEVLKYLTKDKEKTKLIEELRQDIINKVKGIK